MDVSDVLRQRMAQPAGLQRMVSLSLAVHAGVVAALLLAPQGLLTRKAETARTVMTISLGGSGGSGPQNGGMTAIGGRPVQTVQPPEEPQKRQAERPPAAKAPGMTVPTPAAKPVKKGSTAVVKAPDEARGQKPTKGDQLREGTAIADTGARGKGFGLSTGGTPGSGATLDVADFCCPEYILQMVERIKSTWDQQGGATAVVIVRFT